MYGSRTDHYPATSKLLHWLVAACVLTTAPVAVAMTRVDKGPTQDALFAVHKSIGVLILILVILRLINRLAVGAPIAEPGIERWQKVVSATVHTLFYVLLIALPLTGLLAVSGRAEDGLVPLKFGLALPAIPGIPEENGFGDAHEVLVFTTLALVVLHVGAALKNQFASSTDVADRMPPFRSRNA